MGACPAAGLCGSCERPQGLMTWHRALVSFLVSARGRSGRFTRGRGLRLRAQATPPGRARTWAQISKTGLSSRRRRGPRPRRAQDLRSGRESRHVVSENPRQVGVRSREPSRETDVHRQQPDRVARVADLLIVPGSALPERVGQRDGEKIRLAVEVVVVEPSPTSATVDQGTFSGLLLLAVTRFVPVT